CKAGDTHWRYRSFSSAANHRVGIAALDDLVAVSYCMGSGGAGSAGGGIGALGPEADRNLSCRQIHNSSGNKERGYRAGAAFQEFLVFPLNHSKSAYARTDECADARSILGPDLEAGISDGFLGRSQGVMDKDIHLLYFFFLNELERIEVLDFAGNADWEAGNVESGYGAERAAASQEIGPHFFFSVAGAADKADPGYNHTAIQGRTSIPRSRISDYLACFSMYSMASRTLVIFSASSSGISMLNS